MEPLSFTNLIMVGLQKMNPYASHIADLFLLICLIFIVFVIYQRGSKFAYQVPHLLITLGSIGAILGVAIGLSAFDVHQIQASLPLLLNGLKFAAMISILTIGAALIAKIINNTKRIIPRDKTIDHGVTPAMVYLVLREISDHGAEQKVILSSMADRTKEYQYLLQRVLDLQQNDLVQQISLLEDIKRSLIGKEESSLIGQLQRLHLGLQTELQQAEQISTRRFENLAGQLHTWSEQMVENRLPSLLQTLTESNHSFTDQVNEKFKQLNQTTTSLEGWQEDYGQQLTRVNDQFTLSVASLQQSGEALQAMVSQTQALPAALAQLTEVMQGFQQQIQQTDAQLRDFQQLPTEVLPALGENLDTMVQRLHQRVQGHLELVQVSLETQLDMAESSLETQLAGFTALQAGFTQLESQTVQSIEQWQDDLTQILTHFTGSLQQATGPWLTDLATIADTVVDKREVDREVKNTMVLSQSTGNGHGQLQLDGDSKTPFKRQLGDSNDSDDENDDEVWQNRGFGLMEAGHYLEAIVYFDKAIELTPTEFSLFYNKACCYALAGRHQEQAIQALRQAILLNPECREMAMTDSDFEEVRSHPKFHHWF